MHAKSAVGVLERPATGETRRVRPASILVLGLGNTLLGDDGAGVQAVHQLQDARCATSKVEFVDGGTLSFSLLETIESAPALIVVDAAEFRAPAGTVQVFRQSEMDQFLRAPAHSSVHELGLAELLDMARLRARLPRWRALVGIQPEGVASGTQLSSAVEAGLEIACMHVRALVALWTI